VVNWGRTSLRREPLFQEIPEHVAPPETRLAAIDVQLMLRTCKKNDRIVLRSYYLEDCNPKEIALAHGVSVTAIRLRLLRARRGVAKTLNAIFAIPHRFNVGEVCLTQSTVNVFSAVMLCRGAQLLS
jgi:DNA-directed RNA polymerase specialized sigma24 family protein